MFEITGFARHLDGEGKEAAISKLRSFSTEMRRSYIDFTLTRLRNELCSDSFHAVLAWNSRPAV